jgi:uncharacterized protein YbbK (DUF523 family)
MLVTLRVSTGQVPPQPTIRNRSKTKGRKFARISSPFLKANSPFAGSSAKDVYSVKKRPKSGQGYALKGN